MHGNDSCESIHTPLVGLRVNRDGKHIIASNSSNREAHVSNSHEILVKGKAGTRDVCNQINAMLLLCGGKASVPSKIIHQRVMLLLTLLAIARAKSAQHIC